jgi:hypothetical protein
MGWASSSQAKLFLQNLPEPARPLLQQRLRLEHEADLAGSTVQHGGARLGLDDRSHLEKWFGCTAARGVGGVYGQLSATAPAQRGGREKLLVGRDDRLRGHRQRDPCLSE